jgi:Tfp pilus assembly protein PilW
MKLFQKTRRTAAFTLVECIVAVGIMSIILLALVVGSVSLIRSYNASDQFATAQNSELRVMDYLTRDLRRAGFGGLSAPAAWGGTSTSAVYMPNSAQVSMLIPDYYSGYDSSGNPSTRNGVNSVPLDPVISGGTPVFGSHLLIVTYYVDSTTQSLIRQVVWTANGSTHTSTTAIADGVQLFQLGFGITANVVTATITFLPIFERNTQVTARQGTTLNASVTLRDAPSS